MENKVTENAENEKEPDWTVEQYIKRCNELGLKVKPQAVETIRKRQENKRSV